MSPGNARDGTDESALQAFLAALPPTNAVALRSLAHAWQASGGEIQVGRVTVRLATKGRNGRTFTAATLHALAPNDRAERRFADDVAGPQLEISRVLLVNHGVTDGDWLAWSDDLAELQLHGFDAQSKFPTIALETLPPASVARLAQALRDLGRLAQGHPA